MTTVSAPSVSLSPSAEFVTTAITPKPWGHEVIFAAGEHGYVGKIIAVNAGFSLSLQFHHEKDETLSFVSGEALVEFGPSADRLETRTVRAGETMHVPASVLHRVTAVTDVVFAEASTAGPGWRDDVVRVADRYGRSGTSAP